MSTKEALDNGIEPKNWAFPKIHILIQHAFDNIVAKGITATYNTKPNEEFHGPIRAAYEHTNGKDFEPQVFVLKCDNACVFIYLFLDLEH